MSDDKPATTGAATSRRSVLGTIAIVLGGALVAEVAWLAWAFLRPRGQAAAGSDADRIIVAGPVERFAPESVTAFPEGKFYLVRLADGGFLALHRRCTHLGCTVPWDDSRRCFTCPCHASSFDIRGDVQAPPAPRALDLFPVRIENGVVKIDTSAPVRRRAFAPGQVVRS
jgi:cytochrome b6-f complex iron-sulfur subunit